MPWGFQISCEAFLTLILCGLCSSEMKPEKQCESELDRESEIVEFFSKGISQEAVIA
jgi:hypothetical protein